MKVGLVLKRFMLSWEVKDINHVFYFKRNLHVLENAVVVNVCFVPSLSVDNPLIKYSSSLV